MIVLELDKLEKSFGALRVADNISLEVRAGEALGVIGPNGAGKTTLFGLIAGALQPASGRIRLEGKDVTDSRSGGALPRRNRSLAPGAAAVREIDRV